MQKATIGYSSGLYIKIPRQGQAPMLLMEWLITKGKFKGKFTEDSDDSKIVFRPETMMRSDIEEAQEYINANMPDSESEKHFSWAGSGMSETISLEAIMNGEDFTDDHGQSLQLWAQRAESGEIWASKYDRYQCI